MTRLHKIQREVRGLSATIPDDPPNGFWHKPDRGSPNYFRLVVDGEGRYDIWLETEARFDKAGMMTVSATVVGYNLDYHYREHEVTIFSTGFDGNDQPREQAFLNNLVKAYPDQIQQKVDLFAESAVNWVTSPNPAEA